jgi:hypothetical protein
VTKRRTEIIVEIDEVFAIRRRETTSVAWCAECGEQVQMFSPEEAATDAAASSRAIYRWIEADDVHFTETSGGRVLVCLNSVRRQIL